MATRARSGRGAMERDPDAPPFEWSRDGVATLWLFALILGFIVALVPRR